MNSTSRKAIPKEIKAAYAYCQHIARHHYENFPVASSILPKHLRLPITVIYAFARLADDIADEGDFNAETRFERLDQLKYHLDHIDRLPYLDYLDHLEHAHTSHFCDKSFTSARILKSCDHRLSPEIHHIFLALQHVIKTYQLPISLFYDLLTAFKQDVIKTDYQTFEEVLQYCRYSANPIGRLLLHLNEQATDENLSLSDHICTGLQLINFMQDLRSDLTDRNRCYIPTEDLQAFDLTKQQLLDTIHHSSRQLPTTDSYHLKAQHLFDFEIKRIQTLYDSGKALGKYLPGRFGFEIRLVIAGGQKILDKLKSKKYFSRSKLNSLDWLILCWRAISFCPLGRQIPVS